MEKPLPAGWRWVKLGEICSFRHGGTPLKSEASYWSGEIPWVSPKDMRSSVINDAEDHINDIAIKNSATCLVPKNILLVVVRSGILARYFPVAMTGRDVAFNQDIKAIFPDCSQINYEFLFFILRGLNDFIINHGVKKGATVHSIKSDFIESLKIPLPPLPEQQRIAARLREQMQVVDEARQAAEAQLKAAEQLQGAYLQEAFDEEKIELWPVIKLGDIGEIVSGITLGSKIKKEKTHRVPYLRVANVKDGYLDLSDVKEIETTDVEIEKLRLQKGDLLLTEGGDPDKLGRGTFWDNQINLCLHQNHIFRVRLLGNQFLPSFVSLQIGSYYGKSYFLKHAKQTTGIATINQKVLRAFPLLTPSLFEQQSIVDQFSELAATIAQTQEHLIHQLTAINQLPATLLRQAFSGAL